MGLTGSTFALAKPTVNHRAVGPSFVSAETGHGFLATVVPVGFLSARTNCCGQVMPALVTITVVCLTGFLAAHGAGGCTTLGENVLNCGVSVAPMDRVDPANSPLATVPTRVALPPLP
jgi:hypothetical protein